MRFYVIHLKKNHYWTLAALVIVALFWSTGILQYAEIPVSGLAPYYHGDPTVAKISFTINVDWGEELIPEILKILQEKDIKATFFVTGRWANKFPELVRQIHGAGHEVANHGYSHVHPNQLSAADLEQHIKKNEEIIYQLTGQKNYLYAPPYGEYNKNVVKMTTDLGYKLIMWSVDTIDWQRPSSQVIVNRVLRKAAKGGIVLMHPIKQTVEALPTIIDRLQAKDFQLVTISELLAEKPGVTDGIR